MHSIHDHFTAADLLCGGIQRPTVSGAEPTTNPGSAAALPADAVRLRSTDRPSIVLATATPSEDARLRRMDSWR